MADESTRIGAPVESTELGTRTEAIIPDYVRITAGHFSEDRSYSTYRSRGTDDWLLIHTLSGAGRFGAEDGSEHRSEPGDVSLIMPQTMHDYATASDPGHWEFYYAHFRARGEWRSLLDWPSLVPGIRQLRVTGSVRQHVESNLAEAVRWSHSLLRQNGLLGLNRLEAALLWCDMANPLNVPLDARVREVVEAVENDLRRPWTLTELAETARLSESRFAHLFSDQLGISPLAFVEQQRMTLAAQLLDLTSRSIGSIAAEVGYSDPLYFSSRFRRRYGFSPRGFRNRTVPPEDPS